MIEKALIIKELKRLGQPFSIEKAIAVLGVDPDDTFERMSTVSILKTRGYELYDAGWASDEYETVMDKKTRRYVSSGIMIGRMTTPPAEDDGA